MGVAIYAVAVDREAALPAAVSVVLLMVALVRASGGLVLWAVAGLGGSYGLALALADGDLDARAGFVAAGLLLAGELAFWSAQAGRWPREERAAARARLAGVVILVLAAATIGTLLVAAGAAVPAGTQPVQIVGVLGAIAVLTTLALLARR